MISKIMRKPVLIRWWAGLVAAALLMGTLLTGNGVMADSAQKLPAVNAHKVLVLGDSLSAAYGLQPEKGWVDALSKQFAPNNVQFINASISGSTTAAGLQRLPSLLKQHQPHWVIIELGANDGLQGKPIDYIQNNLVALIEQSKAAGSQVILLGVRLPPNLGRRYTEPFFQIYATLAEKYQLNYVPFILEGVAGREDLMQDDGLHPNQTGQKAVAELLAPALSKFLGVSGKP